MMSRALKEEGAVMEVAFQAAMEMPEEAFQAVLQVT
jgi:hypothetical protein